MRGTMSRWSMLPGSIAFAVVLLFYCELGAVSMKQRQLRKSTTRPAQHAGCGGSEPRTPGAFHKTETRNSLANEAWTPQRASHEVLLPTMTKND